MGHDMIENWDIKRLPTFEVKQEPEEWALDKRFSASPIISHPSEKNIEELAIIPPTITTHWEVFTVATCWT